MMLTLSCARPIWPLENHQRGVSRDCLELCLRTPLAIVFRPIIELDEEMEEVSSVYWD